MAFTPIRGKRLRVTQLDDCGRITSSSTYVVTEGFITLTLTPQVEDGTDIIVRNANGAICVNERGNPSFTGFEVGIEFCEVDPSLMSIVTNAEDYEDAQGAIAGFTVPEGEITGHFALELWTGVAGVACGDEGDEASGYILLPLVKAGTLGDLSVGGEDAVTFSLANSTTRGGNTWEEGPYDVIQDAEGAADKLPTPLDSRDHLLMVETFVSPPPVTDAPELVSTGD